MSRYLSRFSVISFQSVSASLFLCGQTYGFIAAILVILAGVVLNAPYSLQADILRYADTMEAYNDGTGAHPDYLDPTAALGQPASGHTPLAPENNDPGPPFVPYVVSLGQQGSITLGFDRPILNHVACTDNPYGYDLLIWGNTFQGGQAITPEFEFGRFQEQGFVEVARADANGEPTEWFLILPRIFYDSVQYDPDRPGSVPRDFTPAELLVPIVGTYGEFLASGDLSISACLFDGFADAVPMQGSVLETIVTSNDLADVVLDNPETFEIEGLGGGSIDLSRAVRQTSPGVPELDGDGFQFVELRRIDLIRITDAKLDDMHSNGLGAITTEIDGVIVLPNLGCPDPFADADGDGDVDQVDFGLWQVCFTGDGGSIIDSECECFDRNRDGDVDSNEDFAAFQACADTSGPTIPADPNCDGP